MGWAKVSLAVVRAMAVTLENKAAARCRPAQASSKMAASASSGQMSGAIQVGRAVSSARSMESRSSRSELMPGIVPVRGAATAADSSVTDVKHVELSAGGSGGLAHVGDVPSQLAGDGGEELVQFLRRPLGHQHHAAVAEVLDVAGNEEPSGDPPSRIAEADPLDVAGVIYGASLGKGRIS